MFAQILRQPLFHFALIGVALFALFSVTPGSDPQPEPDRIVVSVQDATWLAQQFQATWRRDPTVAELDSLIDDFVREEIYVREALALGLDQGDAVVRRRLRQKMEFLTEAGAEAATPQEDTLRAFFQDNADTFEQPPILGFSQILVPTDNADISAQTILADLAAGAAPDALGARSLLPPRLPASPQQTVDGTFGSGFFDQLAALPEGTWSGPVASGYGQHIVRVDYRKAGALPPFDEVRDRVEFEWRAQMAADLRSQRYQELASRYLIERPDPDRVMAP